MQRNLECICQLSPKLRIRSSLASHCMTRLRVIDLSVTRGDRTVLKALDFSVGIGEVLHVQGRNGAGKTTLLEVLSGLRAPARGRIEAQPPADTLHWIGHRNALHPALSPLENLHYWCRLHGASTQGVESALQRLGLHRQRHRPSGKLSMGQRRRAALARLLAVSRPWWMLDEPLAGLDVPATEFVAGLLAEHAAAGGAVLVTSHQPFPVAISGLRELVLT